MCGYQLNRILFFIIAGGQCIDLINDYKCICDAGYTGSRCQHEVDSCESEPCQNGGTCMDHIDGFSCLCRPGFVGLQCEAEVDECISSPCDSTGTEKCVDLDNGFKCQCNPGFTGELCEVSIFIYKNLTIYMYLK